METIELEKIDEVYFKINTSPCIIDELYDHFSFRPKGFQFTPSFKAKKWDGWLHLIDKRYNRIYQGLLNDIKEFAKSRDYNFIYNNEQIKQLSDIEINEFIKKLNLPFSLREIQFDCIKIGLNQRRRLLIAPTSSGKSLIIYSLIRYWQLNKPEGKKALIIVPRINLVSQLLGDFKTYGENDPTFNPNDFAQIFSGNNKNSDKPIYISTWQSLFNEPTDFFEQFDFVCCDEAHLAKANCLKNIMSACINAKWRFGLTGTLDESLCNAMVIQGLTGSIYQATTTEQEIKKNNIAKLNPILCIVMKYTDQEKEDLRKYCINKKNRKTAYAHEMKFIVTHEKRNNFIINLAKNCKGNTIVMFQYIAHGKYLFDKLVEGNILINGSPSRKIFFVDGGTDNDSREEVRRITENENNAIIVASVGVFGTGTNIKKLDNLIFASPSKSQVRVLQCIGRILRLANKNKVATVYDITDDLSIGGHKNFGIKHLIERTKIYDKEHFEYKFFNINLNIK